MIDKILERLAEREDYLVEQFRGACDTEDLKWVSKIQEVENSKKIVQEVAKEYGKDTNVPSNGWIPSSERLPQEHLWGGRKKSAEVFVTYLDGGGEARVDTDHTYDGEWHYYGYRVIAWMPKKSPDPYQKGE